MLTNCLVISPPLDFGIKLCRLDCKQVIKVIWHKPHCCRTRTVHSFSPDGANVHPHLVHIHPIGIRTGASPCWVPLSLSSPGMFWAYPFSPSKVHLHVMWGSGPYLIHSSLSPPKSTFPTISHHDRFCRFCTAHGRDRQTDGLTDHATPSVAIGLV